MALSSWIESLRTRCIGYANSSRRTSSRSLALQSRASRRRLGSGEPSYEAQAAEQLEDRTLLSVSALLINGTLNVTASGADNITVSANSTTGRVEVRTNNGVLVGAVPSVNASALTGLVVTGSDSNNVIDLSGVTAAQFTALVSIKVSAGDGNDRVTGSPDIASSLNGGDGADTLTGGSNNDTLNGGNGADSITGGLGNDSLLGSDGADTISGDDGNDTIIAGNGNDSVDAGNGADSVEGNNGADTLLGNTGDDTINGDGGTDSISGGDGNDVILGGEFNDNITGDAGNDTIDAQAGDDTVDGGTGDDSLLGNSGNDSLLGNTGNDNINGEAGNDTLSGNDGNDLIFGGAGDDSVFGDGRDSLSTESGNDSLFGQSGRDTVIGGLGQDSMDGGTGNDLISSFFDQIAVGTITPAIPQQPSITPLQSATISIQPGAAIPVNDSPSSVSSGDIDGDGDIDVVEVSRGSGTFSVLSNDGLGNLSVTQTTAIPLANPVGILSSELADIDGDSDVDLLVGNNAGVNPVLGNVRVFINNGLGVFTSAGSFSIDDSPLSLIVIDLDGDGDRDIATANFNSNTTTILLNDGTGTFGARIDLAAGINPYTISGGDMDGDGDLDLVVSSLFQSVSVLLNNGNATFQPFRTYPVTSPGNGVPGGTLADFDRDGDLDIVSANSGGFVSLLRNNGNATFATAIDFPAIPRLSRVAAADFNGDAAMDLLVVTEDGVNAATLLNDGTGGFLSPQTIALASNAGGNFIGNDNSISIADFDSDGAIDAIVTNKRADNLQILFNRSFPANTPPVAVDDLSQAFKGTSTTIDVVSNDVDSDGVLIYSTVAIIAQPSNGVASSLGNGLVIYTPTSGFIGTDSFTYNIRDNRNGLSNVATVTAGPASTNFVCRLGLATGNQNPIRSFGVSWQYFRGLCVGGVARV